MRKIAIVIALSLLCATVFAQEYLGRENVRLSPNGPEYSYAFFSVNLNNPVDILSLAFGINEWSLYELYFFTPPSVFENIVEQVDKVNREGVK